MKTKNVLFILVVYFLATVIVLLQSSNVSFAATAKNKDVSACKTLACKASTFSLMVADIDGSNMSIIQTHSNKDMTHPRVSGDKNWVMYTTYNKFDRHGCGEPSGGYFKTELRAVRMDGTQDKNIIGPKYGHFHSNNYFIGQNNDITFLAGPVTALKFYRWGFNALMDPIGKPVELPTVKTIAVVMDPQARVQTDKIVFAGLYNPGGAFIKSIFMMNLSDSEQLVGLSVGKDRSGKPIICENAACENIMENDPKISPDGSKVAFMRQAPKSGDQGFGWHIFVVDVNKPLSEKDISYAALGSDVKLNDALPEWIDNETLIFSTIEIKSSTNVVKDVYTMKADGSQRTKINLPQGFRYSDVFPFTDSDGKQRMILSARKINSVCQF